MSANLKQRITEKLSIIDVVSDYVTLQKAGKNYKARCPFHSERTPSFFVSPDKDIAYCFSCHKGGDMFAFIQEIEGCTFRESLQILAEKSGIDAASDTDLQKLSEAGNHISKDEKETIYTAYRLAEQYFQKNLASKEGEDAYAYLQNRGLKESTIQEFGVGYALPHWEDLRVYMHAQGYTDGKLHELDLLKAREGKVAQFFDTFRDRITFPIADSYGHTVAFGARSLGSEEPKYLNSAEHSLYHKGKTLYNFHRAKSAIKQNDATIVVEGYMDAIMLYQSGFHNVVASLGTAFGNDQIKKLSFLSKNIVFAYDSDSAGQNALKESTRLALRFDMDVFVLPLPGAKDPADLCLEDGGVQSITEALQKRVHVFDYFLDFGKNNYNFKDAVERKNFAIEMLDLIASANNALIREAYIQKLSDITRFSYENLMQMLRSIAKEKQDKDKRKLSRLQKKEQNDDKPKLSHEDYLLGLCIHAPKLCQDIPQDFALSHPKKQQILDTIRSYETNEDADFTTIKESFWDEQSQKYISYLAMYMEANLGAQSESWMQNERKKLLELLGKRKEKSRREEVRQQLSDMEQAGQMDKEYFSLLEELKKL